VLQKAVHWRLEEVVVCYDFWLDNNFYLKEEKRALFPETRCSSSFKKAKNPID